MKEKTKKEMVDTIAIKGVWIYQKYCGVKNCTYEKMGLSVGHYPMFAAPGGTPSCPECSEKKRHSLGIESAYGKIKIKVYKVDAEYGGDQDE